MTRLISAFDNLNNLFGTFTKNFKVHALTTMHRYQFTTVLRKKAIQAMAKFLKRTAGKAFDRWKSACIE